MTSGCQVPWASLFSFELYWTWSSFLHSSAPTHVPGLGGFRKAVPKAPSLKPCSTEACMGWEHPGLPPKPAAPLREPPCSSVSFDSMMVAALPMRLQGGSPFPKPCPIYTHRGGGYRVGCGRSFLVVCSIVGLTWLSPAPPLLSQDLTIPLTHLRPILSPLKGSCQCQANGSVDPQPLLGS